MTTSQIAKEIYDIEKKIGYLSPEVLDLVFERTRSSEWTLVKRIFYRSQRLKFLEALAETYPRLLAVFIDEQTAGLVEEFRPTNAVDAHWQKYALKRIDELALILLASHPIPSLGATTPPSPSAASAPTKPDQPEPSEMGCGGALLICGICAIIILTTCVASCVMFGVFGLVVGLPAGLIISLILVWN